MLTSKDIEQSEQLTEEYGKPDCRNPAFDSQPTSPATDYKEQARQIVLGYAVKGDLESRITAALQSAARSAREAERKRCEEIIKEKVREYHAEAMRDDTSMIARASWLQRVHAVEAVLGAITAPPEQEKD